MRSAIKTSALAIFLAILGFSYAVATHVESESPQTNAGIAHVIAPRIVTPDLRFTNPYLIAGTDAGFPSGGNTSDDPQGFDLGDANSGETVSRYLTATGAALPFTFSTQANFDVFGTDVVAQIPPTPTSITLGQNGKIVYAFKNPDTIKRPARFNATVTDFLGTQRFGLFRINLFPATSPSEFRFAQDTLSVAQLGSTYFMKLDTIAAAGAPTFTIIPGTITLNGTSYASLEALGLTLSNDGMLFGRPIFTRAATTTTANPNSKIKFTVQATDTKGIKAMGRNSTASNQTFALTVEDNPQATSEILTTACTLNTVSTVANKDVFTFNGAFDPKGMNDDSLAGSPFTLRINGTTFTGNFNSKGMIKNKNGLNVTMSPTNATIQVRLAGANFSTLSFGASGSNSTPLVIFMEFKHYITCETLLMYHRAVNTKHALTYRLGSKFGQAMAGGMQILSASGKDSKFVDGTQGDAWYVRFLGVPRFAIDSGASTAFPVRDNSGGVAGTVQTGSVSATITIGDAALGPVTAKVIVYRLNYKSTGSTPGIYNLTLDGVHYLHSVITNSISPDDTGIEQAINSTNPSILRFGLDIKNFSGATSRVIVPNGFSWQSK